MKGLHILRVAVATGIVLAGLSGARADEQSRPPEIEQDIKLLPAEGEYAGIRDTLETCVTCHGLNGPSAEPVIPVLSGQQLYYIYVQLKDFKAGRRSSDVMESVAQSLEKEQMQLIAKFYSEQNWPRLGYRGDAEKVQRGQVAAESGECTACHLGKYEGNSRVPHIGGQQYEYLLKTMMDLKAKTRANAAVMADLFGSYSDEDIAAMAVFLADY